MRCAFPSIWFCRGWTRAGAPRCHAAVSVLRLLVSGYSSLLADQVRTMAFVPRWRSQVVDP
jgi:hypothetical protein